MLGTLHDAVRDVVILRSLPHDPQHIAGREQPHGRLGDLLLGDQALFVSAEHVEIGVAAVQVAAVFQGQGRGLGRGRGDHMSRVEIPYGPAVGHDVALKAPLAPQGVPQQRFAAAAGLTVGAVVSAHDGLHAGLFHQVLKGREIGLLHVLGRRLGIEAVAQILRPAVDGKMLCAGGGLHGLAAALKPPHIGLPQPGGQIGVLSVGLVSPAPAGVPEDVDVRRPEGQPVIDVPISQGGQGVVLGPALRGRQVAQPFQPLVVEHGRQADGLGEAGGAAAPGHTV